MTGKANEAGRVTGGARYAAALLAMGLLAGPVASGALGQVGAPVGRPPAAAVPPILTNHELPAAATRPSPVVKTEPKTPAAPSVASPSTPAGPIVPSVAPSGGPSIAAPATAMPAVPAPAAPATPAVAAPAVKAPSVATPTVPTTPVVPAIPAVAAPKTPVAVVPPVPAPAAPATPTAPATAAATTAVSQEDGKAYPVSEIKVGYVRENDWHPGTWRLLEEPVELGVANGGYVAPRPNVPHVKVKIGDIGKGPVKVMYGSAFKPVYEQMVRTLNRRGLIGVFVVVSPADIDGQNTDLRPAERRDLKFLVYTSTIKQVRTVATSSDGKAPRIDLAQHEMIRENSPVDPGYNNLLRKDVLDDYVLRLNRHPGRRVDVAVSGTETPGEVNLDYLVAENRPWYVYAQISNTGTAQTDQWRERFGFVDNQLTGNDDILSVDYITAGFSKSHAVLGAYELPVFRMDRLRMRTYAAWNEFTASDVGLALERFSGSAWSVGDEFIWNFYQQKNLFLDMVAGVRFQQVEVDNETFGATGHGDYVNPYAGVRLERNSDIYQTNADVTVTGGLSNSGEMDLTALGRPLVDQNWVILQVDASHSFYLEPLLFPREFARGGGTLAHELFFSMRSQWAFDYRLIPQSEQVIGGLYTVRGYPESVAAGDSMIVGTAEYRFHLPRALKVQADPSRTKLFGHPFRFSPQQPYGRPDWDLITRAFVDVGRAVNSDRLSFETNETLVGAGLGLELQFKQNFNIRADWGAALRDAPEVTAGSNRFHIVATFLY